MHVQMLLLSSLVVSLSDALSLLSEDRRYIHHVFITCDRSKS